MAESVTRSNGPVQGSSLLFGSKESEIGGAIEGKGGGYRVSGIKSVCRQLLLVTGNLLILLFSLLVSLTKLLLISAIRFQLVATKVANQVFTSLW